MRRGRWGMLAVVGLLACGGSGPSVEVPSPAVLAEVVATTQCPAGGKAILRGVDDDGDGRLSSAEVDSTELVCSDASAPLLVERTTEPTGAICPEGGVRIRVGTDGDGNGVLSDAEVVRTEYACERASALLLVERTAEPAGENCAQGGHRIRAGDDRDGDGVLSDAEVERTLYGCASGPSATLSRTRAEPAGSNCASGGTAVQVGADANASGVLDDAEVQDTSYVCDVAPAALLLRTVQLYSSDAACLQDGHRVDAGPDTNGNGVLDDAEVVSSRVVCPQDTSGWTYWGDYSIRTAADVAALTGVSRIAGRLSLEDSELVEVDLPRYLRIVDGLIVRNNPRLVRLGTGLETVLGEMTVENNPELEDVWGFLRLIRGNVRVTDNAALTSFSPGSEYARLNGNLVVTDNPALMRLDLSDVYTIRGAFHVARNASLGSITFPSASWQAMDFIGSLTIEDNAVLRSAGIKATQVGGDVRVVRNPLLEQLAFAFVHVPGSLRVEACPSLWSLTGEQLLETVGGDLRLEGLTNLAYLELERLRFVGGDLRLVGTQRLTSVWQADLLQAIGGNLYVQDNTRLSSLHLLALGSVGGAVVLERNAQLQVPLLGSLSRARELVVADNARLLNLEGFAGVQRLEALRVQRNPALTWLDMRSLASVYALTIEDNVALPTCRALALQAQLTQPAGSVSIRGNLEGDASCP